MSKRILVSTCESGHFAHAEALVHHYLDPRGGVEITQAEDYEKCVRLASSDNYDLVVFFGQTTSAGGTYTEGLLANSIRAIREIKAKVATPIIALSTFPQLEEQPLSAIADVFLAMPYELKDFKTAVDRCLRRDAKEGNEAGAMLEPQPPHVEVSQPASPPGPVVRLRRKDDPQNPAPVRIVIVDAEEVLADVMRMLILSKYAVDLKVFTSSFLAWQELERSDPDLLITDCIMPEMSGEEIVRGLMKRKIAYPILVMSGYLKGEVVLGWFPGAPNISFLAKPFTPQNFYAELSKHFEPVPVGK